MRVVGRIRDALSKTRRSASHLQNFIHVTRNYCGPNLSTHVAFAWKKVYESSFRWREIVEFYRIYNICFSFHYFKKEEKNII